MKQHVLDAIAEERKYQQSIGNKAKTVGEEILLCQAQLREAQDTWVAENGSVGSRTYDNQMRIFRRICANLIRCMEKHGTAGTKKGQLGRGSIA